MEMDNGDASQKQPKNPQNQGFLATFSEKGPQIRERFFFHKDEKKRGARIFGLFFGMKQPTISICKAPFVVREHFKTRVILMRAQNPVCALFSDKANFFLGLKLFFRCKNFFFIYFSVKQIFFRFETFFSVQKFFFLYFQVKNDFFPRFDDNLQAVLA